MSLENLDKIRPLGVWSKYVIGACKMPHNNDLCRFMAANKPAERNISSANIDDIADGCNKNIDEQQLTEIFRSNKLNNWPQWEQCIYMNLLHSKLLDTDLSASNYNLVQLK